MIEELTEDHFDPKVMSGEVTEKAFWCNRLDSFWDLNHGMVIKITQSVGIPSVSFLVRMTEKIHHSSDGAVYCKNICYCGVQYVTVRVGTEGRAMKTSFQTRMQ